jgi:hypothetical protein
MFGKKKRPDIQQGAVFQNILVSSTGMPSSSHLTICDVSFSIQTLASSIPFSFPDFGRASTW